MTRRFQTRELQGWPDPLARMAFHGPIGEWTQLVTPHSEADPAALLIQLLVAVGNVVGREPYFRVEADRLRMNLFAAIVGKSAKARKGTSWGQVKATMASIDPGWASSQITNGLSSGEGLIERVADATPPAEQPDRRLLVVESEFGKPLTVMHRDGNTLSAIVREAWDSGDLNILTRNSPRRATGAHISVIGHVTVDDLLENLQPAEAANGFANRFLWVLARRSKLLPEGGQVPQPQLDEVVGRLTNAVNFARAVQGLSRDDDAKRYWARIYEELSEERAGTYGAVTSRAEAYVCRLACIYALMDLSATVTVQHLEAALAVWRYCDESARIIFDVGPDDDVQNNLRLALDTAGDAGLTRTEMRDLFDRNVAAATIQEALNALERSGRYRRVSETTGGRPAERWVVTSQVERAVGVERAA